MVSAFIVLLAAYNLWQPFDNTKIYYTGVAIAIFLMILSIHLSAEGNYKIFTLAFSILSLSNVLDEVFFDASVIDINEYIAATFTLIVSIYLYYAINRKGLG